MENERRRIVVNLDQPQVTPQAPSKARASSAPSFGYQTEALPKKKRGWLLKVLLGFAVLLLLVAVVGAVGGYFWWQSLIKSPSYSLALLIDAARRDDKPQIEGLLDTNLVVENFVPQVIERAKDRYGRGFPPQVVERATAMLTPILPAVKERARVEIPRLIREKLQNTPEVSPWAMAIGINRAATVQENGDTATVKTVLQNREIEVTLQRNADRWKVVGLKDDVLADKIADSVGQKVLQVVSQRPNTAAQNRMSQELTEQIKRQIQQLTP